MIKMDELFDLEHFSLFLAANLMGGRETMEEHLGKSLPSLSPSEASSLSSLCLPPMYWRSPLLVDSIDPATLAPATHPPNALSSVDLNLNLEVVFVDVTFSFRAQLPSSSTTNTDTSDDKNPSSSISVAFGAFLRLRHTESDDDFFFYVKGSPATRNYLRDHMDQHDTVLEETKSFVIAKHMALALHQLQQNLAIKVKNTDEASSPAHGKANNGIGIRQVDIPLLYDDGSETSMLAITNSSGASVGPLDRNVASTWLCGMLSGRSVETPDANETSDPSRKWKPLGTEDSQQLWGVFEDWKRRAIEHLQDEASRSILSQESLSNADGNENQNHEGESPAKESNKTARAKDATVAAQSPSPAGKSNADSKGKSKKPKVVRPRPMGMRVGGMKKKPKTKNKFSSAK